MSPVLKNSAELALDSLIKLLGLLGELTEKEEKSSKKWNRLKG